MNRTALLPLLLIASITQAAPCTVTERQVLGAWVAVGGSGFFEQMAFERNGLRHEFNSWLHDRPEILGATWQLDGCNLTILDPSGPPQGFQVSRKGKRIILLDVEGRTASSYRKVVEKISHVRAASPFSRSHEHE